MLDNSLVGNTTGVNTPEKIMRTIKKQVCATCIKSGYCYDFQHGIIRGDGCDSWEDREKKEEPRILDSGDRTEFATGAVRDMRAGKGRMDLLPLGVVEELLGDDYVIVGIRCFMEENDTVYLRGSLREFARNAYNNCYPTMLLEVGKHFEEGAKKYGENNWQKGIEPKYYVDSAIRHYLKWRRGDKDEPHDRAFVWNIMCCIWEVDWHEKEEKKDIPVEECLTCKYSSRPSYEYPCNECDRDTNYLYEPKEKVESCKMTTEKIEEVIVATVKETNRMCDTCKYGGPTLCERCNDCRYYCNWEPKEEKVNGQE